LNNGTWDGDQLIPAAWVNESTSLYGYPYSESEPYGYGYQWWLNLEINGYLAISYNGQQINVVPEHNLVVVFTADHEDATFATIMRDYIVASIGYGTPTPIPFPLTLEQILMISQVLMVVAFIVPFIGLVINEIRIRRKREDEETPTT
jgi:CubicO group peptidase (beta-lactamase class C family)